MLHVGRAAVLLCLLGLAACDPRDAKTPLPSVQSVPAVVSAAPDPSVPPAASVITPPTTPTAQDSASGRANGKLTSAQESSAMPMSGQVNNHSSTALDPAKRGASAP